MSNLYRWDFEIRLITGPVGLGDNTQVFNPADMDKAYAAWVKAAEQVKLGNIQYADLSASYQPHLVAKQPSLFGDFDV